MDSFKFSFIARQGMTVPIFLAALYRSSPSEIAPFFAATEPLEKLLQEFTAIDVSFGQRQMPMAPPQEAFILKSMRH